MSDLGLNNDVRAHRDRAGLSQQSLAELVGVSRQAIIAIEQGRQVPSTTLALRLAQALGQSVESLFRLTPGEGVEVRLAPGSESRRGTRVAVGEVDGEWVAHRLPLDPTAAAPADGIMQGRSVGDRAVVSPLGEPAKLRRNVIVSGCAPVLGTLTQRVASRFADAHGIWLPASSGRSLDLLDSRLVHVAGLHVSDPRSADANVEAVRVRFPGESMLVVNLTRWRAGLVLPNGNPRGIRSGADLLQPGLRIALREQGSGAHQLLEQALEAEGADSRTVAGPFAAGHAEVAHLVRYQAADAGIAIEAVALAAGLDFIPLAEERFDLVIPTRFAGVAPVSRLIETLGDPSFRAEMAQLPGYDSAESGHARTLDAA